jgi:glucuronate isomerase
MDRQKSTTAELANELLDQVIQSLPVIDIHTHITPDQPSARDLGEILFYHYIVTELVTSGVSPELLQQASTTGEKIQLFLSAVKPISNTITFWCLRRVLELYGVGEDLGAEALWAVEEGIRKSSSDPDWPRRVLREKGKIHKTILTLNFTEPMPSFDRDLFAGSLRFDDIVTCITPEQLRNLELVCDVKISDLAGYEQAIGKRLSALAASGIRVITVGLLPEDDYVPADRQTAEALFSAFCKGRNLDLSERAALHSSLLTILAGFARDLHLPFQLLIGVRRPFPGDVAMPVVRPELVTRYAALFHDFSTVRFDLFLCSVAHSQELAVVAKNYPNVSISGHWWYAFAPPYIRSMLTERLFLLPAVKLHGFFSDAYNVEWSIGKIALFRRELAWVLADMIISGYLAESQALEVARGLLYDNPARFYGISDAL